MFKNKIILWGSVLSLLAILVYVFVDSSQAKSEKEAAEVVDPAKYVQTVAAAREEKDERFKTSGESPIKDKQAFEGLKYYAPDLKYRIEADIEMFSGEDYEFEVPYTDGSKNTYEKYGYAEFDLDGEHIHLLLLLHDGVISILFRDATSGKETYGGGRYIDYPLDRVKNGKILIDFNDAYSPYCAYSPEFACPLPPKENTMKVAILAGEKYQAEK